MHGETTRASWTFSHKKTMVKGIPFIGHEGPRGCGCKGARTYVAYTQLWTPRAVWIRRSEENLQPSDTRDWTPAIEPITKRLVAWATWPAKKAMTLMLSPLFHLKETHSSWRHHCELMLSLVSAKLPCLPPSLCHKKKKTLLLWVRKASSIFGLKSCNFAACISTCSVHYPTPPTLLHNTEDSFCYLWSASWGVFSLQRRGQHSSAPNPAMASK